MPETNTSTETVNLHTAISLAPGVDLMVRADFASDPDTQVLVDHLVEHLDRGNRERELRATIAQAQQIGGDDGAGILQAALEMFGYIDNRTRRTCDQLAAAVSALMPLASALELVQACESADFEIDKLDA